MYISVFRWGSRSSRNYFSNVKTKAIASDSRKVNGAQCRQSRCRSYQQKEVFRDALLDLIGINFRIYGILIDHGHPGDVFDVGYAPFERSPEAAISHGAAGGASVAIV